MRIARKRFALMAGLAALIVGVVGVAVAATAPSSPTNQTSVGRGINEYGMTRAFFNGQAVPFTYTHGFYCDRSVSSSATTGCEAGANFKVPPAKDFDPLFITVPLGFTQPNNMIDCPGYRICVDHPATIDLSRLEPALKPLYPTLTNAQLTAALKNFAVPSHDHFVTTRNGGHIEWWDVKVVGVTSPTTFNAIRAHRSYSYIDSLIKAKNKNVVGPIDTNLFLFFAVY